LALSKTTAGTPKLPPNINNSVFIVRIARLLGCLIPLTLITLFIAEREKKIYK